MGSTTVADLVACGAAAGMSAAFKAPVGGMLYVMELSTRWRLELTWRTFFSTSVTALALSTLMRGCERNAFCGAIMPSGSKSHSPYDFSTPYMQLPYIVVFAVAMGLGGALYVSINCRIVKLRQRWSKYRRLLFLEVRACASDLCFVAIHRLGES